MEDGIEQHRSMLLDRVNNMEKMSKYMFLYTPYAESEKKDQFITYDAKEAIDFCIKNKCKIEIFYLDILRWEYESTNAFITPLQ